jgi:hypothetical protein
METRSAFRCRMAKKRAEEEEERQRAADGKRFKPVPTLKELQAEFQESLQTRGGWSSRLYWSR